MIFNATYIFLYHYLFQDTLYSFIPRTSNFTSVCYRMLSFPVLCMNILSPSMNSLSSWYLSASCFVLALNLLFPASRSYLVLSNLPPPELLISRPCLPCHVFALVLLSAKVTTPRFSPLSSISSTFSLATLIVRFKSTGPKFWVWIWSPVLTLLRLTTLMDFAGVHTVLPRDSYAVAVFQASFVR